MPMLKPGPVDVHAHVTPAHFPANAAAEPNWPCMQYRSPVDATIMIADKPFRRLDNRSWMIARRLEDMDRLGVSVQVLSPMPELLSYWFGKASAEILSDAINADIAEQISRAPGRFVGLGSVPMQNIELAVKHLARVKQVYGLAGVEIGSNINGTMLGDAQYEPFFAAAEKLELAVFVHALHPIATQALDVHPAFTPMIGFPIDTVMAVASLLMSGTLDRYPRLRIGFSHGGGALAPILHRLDFGWNTTKGFGGTVSSRPSDIVGKMFFDSNVYDPAYLNYIATRLSPGRIVMGTDYPYAIMQPDPVKFVVSALLSADEQESLLWGAAYQYLALD